MENKDFEWKIENQWLLEVLKEVKKQFDEKHDFKEKFKKDAIKTQKQLWQDIGSVSINNGLEQIVDFMEFINTMKIQKRSHEFTRKLEEKYGIMLLSPILQEWILLKKGRKRLKNII
ncbi:helicase [Clostridium tetanomorphum]|nr:helicase [Clostridium tetanomorphum]